MRKVALFLVVVLGVMIGGATSAQAATCVRVFSGSSSVTVCTP